MDPTVRRDIYERCLERHRSGSVIVTSNGGPGAWHAAFADPMRAQSAMDPFTGNAYDLVRNGESYRHRPKPGHDRAEPTEGRRPTTNTSLRLTRHTAPSPGGRLVITPGGRSWKPTGGRPSSPPTHWSIIPSGASPHASDAPCSPSWRPVAGQGSRPEDRRPEPRRRPHIQRPRRARRCATERESPGACQRALAS
jgi:hypothetical protein